jgi:hypothetical protein
MPLLPTLLNVHDLVAILQQFRTRSVLDQAAALRLIDPMEQAARSAATERDAHDAFVRVVREVYVPAIRAAQGIVPAARILDGMAMTMRAGRVVTDRTTGDPIYVPSPTVPVPLQQFFVGLAEEMTARRQPLGFVTQ